MQKGKEHVSKQLTNSAYSNVCITVASRGRSRDWDPAVLGTVQTQNKLFT